MVMPKRSIMLRICDMPMSANACSLNASSSKVLTVSPSTLSRISLTKISLASSLPQETSFSKNGLLIPKRSQPDKISILANASADKFFPIGFPFHSDRPYVYLCIPVHIQYCKVQVFKFMRIIISGLQDADKPLFGLRFPYISLRLGTFPTKAT